MDRKLVEGGQYWCYDHGFFFKSEDEWLHFVPTADDKETTVVHPHTRNYSSRAEEEIKT